MQRTIIAAMGFLVMTSIVPSFGQAGNIPGLPENPPGARQEISAVMAQAGNIPGLPENPPGARLESQAQLNKSQSARECAYRIVRERPENPPGKQIDNPRCDMERNLPR